MFVCTGRERKWLSWSRTIVEEADAKLMFEGRKMLQGLGEPVKARTGAHRLNTKVLIRFLKDCTHKVLLRTFALF